MNKFDKTLVIVFVLSIVLGGFGLLRAYSGNANTVIENANTVNIYGDSVSDIPYEGSIEVLGAVGDTNLTNLVVSGYVDVGTFTQGGGESSTTTPAASTLGADLIDTENVVNIAPLLVATTATTLTLTPSSTFPGIPNAGDSRQIKFSNTTSTTYVLTIAEGTGMDLYQGSTTTVDFIIPIGNSAIINFFRKANTDIEAFMTVFTK